jgi:tape measure domain-containing protein
MASDTETLDILIKLRGGRVAAAEARSVDQAIGGIGKSSRSTAQATGELGRQTQRTGSVMSGTLGIAIRYAAAYQAIHLATSALKSGFTFDSTIEQNTVAFTHFLGSTRAATAYLKDLYQLAATTPFEFTQVSMAAKRMLAFGFSARETVDDLRTLADAASGLGIGSEGIDRLTIALGQMKTKGFVSGDELLQLTEAGINATKYLTDAGLVAQKDLGNIGAKHVDATKAIAAIIAGMKSDFGGMSAAQAKTWQGQLSTIKDYAAQAAGALVKPIFDLGRSSILPSISRHFQNWSKWLNAGGATEIYSTLGKILRILAPLAAAFLAYRAALLAVAAAEWAVATASAAMAIAATLGTVIALIPAITSLADVFYLLSAAITAVGLSIGAVLTLGIGVLVAALVYAYFKVGWFHSAVDALWDGITTGARAIGSAFSAAWGGIVSTFKSGLNWIIGAWNSLHFKMPRVSLGPLGHVGGFNIGVPQIPLLANGGDVASGGRAIVGDAGPELLENRGGTARVTPLPGKSGGGSRMLQPVVWQVDGRTLAEILVDVSQTAAARA